MTLIAPVEVVSGVQSADHAFFKGESQYGRIFDGNRLAADVSSKAAYLLNAIARHELNQVQPVNA